MSAISEYEHLVNLEEWIIIIKALKWIEWINVFEPLVYNVEAQPCTNNRKIK